MMILVHRIWSVNALTAHTCMHASCSADCDKDVVNKRLFCYSDEDELVQRSARWILPGAFTLRRKAAKESMLSSLH